MRRRTHLAIAERGGITHSAIAEAWIATRYAVVGGCAGVLYLVLAIVLHRVLHIPSQIASALGLTAAAAVAYLGHHRVTFAADGQHGRYLPRFLTLTAAAYAVSYVLIALLVDSHTTPYTTAVIAVAATNAVASYLGNRVLVFRTATDERWPEAAEPGA